MLRLRSCRPSTRRLSNANLQHLWENEQAARSQKRKAGSHSIEVSVNNDSEKYNILVPKGKTYRDVAMYVSYLQASNSCAALHEDFAKEENERGEYSEVPAMRSMYDEVTGLGGLILACMNAYRNFAFLPFHFIYSFLAAALESRSPRAEITQRWPA